MKTKTYRLNGGIIMVVLEGAVVSLKRNGQNIIQMLSSEQRKLLDYFALNINQELSHTQIYCGYKGWTCDGSALSKSEKNSVRNQVSRINTICDETVIESKYGSGYCLPGTFLPEEHPSDGVAGIPEVNWKIEDISSEYVGFYLSPKQDACVHGIRLLIQNTGKVTAVHSIHNIDTLCCAHTSVLLKSTDNPTDHKKWKSEYNGTRGSHAFQGDVMGSEDLLIIQMRSMDSVQQMNIILDLKRYLIYKHKVASMAKYSGGLGFEIVLNDVFNGSYAGYIGLIRADKFCDIRMEDDELRKHLSLADTVIHMQLNNEKDMQWFEWFYKKYENKG